MAEGHKYYQPTEYEELLLAAGWLTMTDLDDDYQEYLRNGREIDGYATYDQWLTMKRDWDDANARYEREITPYYTGNKRDESMPEELKNLQAQLLREMSHIEWEFGY